MPREWTGVLAATVAVIAFGYVGSAEAGTTKLKQIGTISNPAGPIDGFDISFVDQKTQRYYLADRSNKSVDIFDAKTAFDDATDGAEQPAYNPADGMFYVAIPELKKDEKKGGVAVIDPKKGKLVKMLSVDNCHPNGLAFGPGGNFALGCTANGKAM